MGNLYVALLVFGCFLSGSLQACEWPPSLWCSSLEIANKCQVEKQCFNNVWSQMVPKQNAAPVQLALYFESKCPGCREFITSQLWGAYQSIGVIMNITLIPYGNAHEQWNEQKHRWQFECQHGGQECTGNLIETCAIKLNPAQSVHIPFIHCIESSNEEPATAAPQCAKTTNITYSAVETCAKGKQGNTWEHKMGLQTDDLDPPHKYVPWITVNGLHTDDIQKQAQTDLTKLVCDMYKGVKPSGCQQMIKRCPRL